MEDKEGKIVHKELAKEYNVSKDTIRDINVGRTWYNDQLEYPLHYSKYDNNRNKKEKNYCIFCGKEISKNSTCCKDCVTFKMRKYNRPPREELKKNIREKTQTEVASIYGVSRSTISRWSLAMNLPSSKTKIDSYTDEEWEKI